MSFIALSELIDAQLLSDYLTVAGGLACRVYDLEKNVVIDASTGMKAPADSFFDLADRSPAPALVSGTRFGALFADKERIGYAQVALRTEADVPAADFAIALLNDQIRLRLARENADFDRDYLQSLITMMQRMAQKLAMVFDMKKAANIFISDCERIFATRNSALLTIGQDRKLELLAASGAPFADFKTAEYVCYSGKPMLSNDVAHDQRFAGRDEPTPAVPNVLAVPLFGGDKVIGVIYLSDKQTGKFTSSDQNMVQALGATVGTTIANIQLHHSLLANERVKSTLERYLSPNLVKEVIQTGGMQGMGGRRAEAAVLFADIRGFTRISEKRSPEEMVRQLNEYFEAMSRIIFAHDGTLDKFVGDLVMVLFGVPRTMPDSAERAVRTAIEMQKHISVLNANWSKQGRPDFGVGIGINFGEVVFGNLGSSRAMGLTVIGDQVNRAQRLESYAKAGEIIISESLRAALPEGRYATSDLGTIDVKGTKLAAHRVNYA